MKSYVKITNNGPVQRECLEFLGLGTTKGNKGQSIGKFTTGFKMAIISATRLGMEVAVSSAGEADSFILNFETVDVDIRDGDAIKKEKLIVYKYSDGKIFKPGISLSAFKEWGRALIDEENKAYPIVREFIANARDEDPDFKIEFDVSDIEQAPFGKTVVYVEQTPEVLDVLKNFSACYFKFLNDENPVLEIPGAGAIYPRSSLVERRFFARGYLVCTEKLYVNMLYEYDIDDADIFSESRGIKNRMEYFRKAAALILRADDFFLRTALNNIFSDPDLCEATFLQYAEDTSEDIREVCREVFSGHPDFGPKAILSGNSGKDDAYAEGLGYKIIRESHKLHGFFEKIGIRTIREIMGELYKAAKFRPPTEEERLEAKRVILKYLWRIRYYRENLLNFPLLTFVGSESSVGLYKIKGWAPDYSAIALRDGVYKSIFSLVKVLDHELCHCVSRFHDSDAGFINWRDWLVAYLLFSLSAAHDKLEELGVKLPEVDKDFYDIEECDEEEIDAWLKGAIKVKI